MESQKITLKAARVNKGMTQMEAAKKLGVSKSTLQNYESGNTIPNWDMVRRIEELYGFKADYLFFTHEYA